MADKLFALGQLLKVVRWFMRVKKKISYVHSNQDFPGTGDHS